MICIRSLTSGCPVLAWYRSWMERRDVMASQAWRLVDLCAGVPKAGDPEGYVWRSMPEESGEDTEGSKSHAHGLTAHHIWCRPVLFAM